MAKRGRKIKIVARSKEKEKLPDVQAIRDKRGISINRVGVENIDFPILISKKDGEKVLVYANIDLFTSLKHQIKGTNMSRFIEVLMEWKYEVLNGDNMVNLLEALKIKMGDVVDVYIRINFKYFLPKISPASKKHSVMAYDCAFIGLLRGNRFKLQLKVVVPTTSLCPCSKEISRYGAHNQRSLATVTIEPLKDEFIWLEDLITLVEKCGSCEIYPLLKRIDEKYVTEKAYKNPRFVEDMGRDVAKSLQSLNQLRSFKIKISNQESIHTHDAVSYIARRLRGKKWKKDNQSLRSE